MSKYTAEQYRAEAGFAELRGDGRHTADMLRNAAKILDAEGDGGAAGGNEFIRVRAQLEAEWCELQKLKDQYPPPARSGVVSDEDVEAACIASLIQYDDGTTEWDGYTDKEKGYAMNRMRASLEHFAKGERHGS